MKVKIEIDLSINERLTIDAVVTLFLAVAFLHHPSMNRGCALVAALLLTLMDLRSWRKERNQPEDPEETPERSSPRR